MEKLKEFMKGWGIAILMIVVLFKSCGTSSDADKASKATVELKSDLDSLKAEFKNIATKKDARDEMEKVMLDFLIYEDELDNKKITVSQIKDKIESND